MVVQDFYHTPLPNMEPAPAAVLFEPLAEDTDFIIPEAVPIPIDASSLPESGFNSQGYNGDKFYNGFGDTNFTLPDYWTLRIRSAQLFNENLYARGIIRRLVTNEINTGLTLDACPNGAILGISDETLNAWGEDIEARFKIWGKDKSVCDYYKRDTFGGLQRRARLEALVCGDVLVTVRPNPVTRAPMIQLISGNKVESPLGTHSDIAKGHTVKHGVELNKQGRTVAFWVRQDDGSIKRMRAYGEKTKRPIAWLVFGTDKRLDDLRGQPLLAIMLQSLRDIDRYRDSVQRKAVINSILALFVKKAEANLGSLPLKRSAIDRKNVDTNNSTTSEGPRSFNIQKYIPGTVIDELNQGEEPVPMSSAGTDEKFGTFEEAIVSGLSWANEIPPEILRLSFSNNYSASQAAINEFNMYLHGFWVAWGEDYCSPIYVEWLISETLHDRVRTPGLLESLIDRRKYTEFGARIASDWHGSIKPSTDRVKQAKGAELSVNNAWSTNAVEARGLNGSSYLQNIKSLRRENQLYIDAFAPLLEFKQKLSAPQAGAPAEGSAAASMATTLSTLIEAVDNLTNSMEV